MDLCTWFWQCALCCLMIEKSLFSAVPEGKESVATAANLGDALLLILALCFHSVFEGIAVGVACK